MRYYPFPHQNLEYSNKLLAKGIEMYELQFALSPCDDSRNSKPYGAIKLYIVWYGLITVFNSSPPSPAYMHCWIDSSFVKIMTCRLVGN